MSQIPPASGQLPELPRVYMDTDDVSSPGKDIVVRAGGSFQAALDQAQPGDVITLQAGATYVGPFVLPLKPGASWITVRSSGIALPAPGVRVGPADAVAMPKLESASGPVLSTAPGAHHYRFIGMEIRPGVQRPALVHQALSWLGGSRTGEGQATEPAALIVNLVLLGSGAGTLDGMPHHMIFERCYIHGDPSVGARRGIAMNSAYTAVVDSYMSDFKQAGRDSQAISVWNGPGPFKVDNDYLEAAGENVMFGGQDPTIPGLVPSDIEVRGNHFAKPLAWRAGDPAYRDTSWAIKNILELKNASRVLIQGNLFEYNWVQSQDGFSILFTVRDQGGAAPWSTVSDVTFVDNVVQHVANGINILGQDDNHPSQQTRRILIENNLFTDVGGLWGSGVLLLIIDGARDITIVHNTALQAGNIVFGEGASDAGFVFTDNIVAHNAYGIIGSDAGIGEQTLTRYFPGSKVQRNVIIGGAIALYPAGNYFPPTAAAVGFADLPGRDYRLAASSPYKRQAGDSRDIGADMGALCKSLTLFSGSAAVALPACSNGGSDRIEQAQGGGHGR